MKLNELREKLKVNNQVGLKKPYNKEPLVLKEQNILLEPLTNETNLFKQSFNQPIIQEKNNENEVDNNAINNGNVIKDDIKIIGVTGSKGKSSVAYILHEYLKHQGYKSILYSSIKIDSPLSFNALNEAVENPLRDERMLLDAIEEACEYEADYLILEVNERAIEKGYTKDIPFDIRVITSINKKHNHVFYDNYIEIKKTFFSEVENDDDVVLIYSCDNQEIFNSLYNINNKKKITYMSKFDTTVLNIDSSKVDYMLTSKHTLDTINGLDLTITTNQNTYDITSNMIMPYNAWNIMGVVAILEQLKVFEINTFKTFIQDLKIPGRDEVIRASDRTIIITQSLSPQLEHLKEYKQRKEINNLIVIAGTTGLGYKTWTKEYSEDKYIIEKEKAIKFAYNYIKKYADMVYITSTDSGATNKEALLNYQASFIEGSIPYITEVDRSMTIKRAIEASNEKDVIIITGRANRRITCYDYDKIKLLLDKDIVMEILESLGWRE